jgi:hypothetical protein
VIPGQKYIAEYDPVSGTWKISTASSVAIQGPQGIQGVPGATGSMGPAGPSSLQAFVSSGGPQVTSGTWTSSSFSGINTLVADLNLTTSGVYRLDAVFRFSRQTNAAGHLQLRILMSGASPAIAHAASIANETLGPQARSINSAGLTTTSGIIAVDDAWPGFGTTHVGETFVIRISLIFTSAVTSATIVPEAQVSGGSPIFNQLGCQVNLQQLY